MKQITCTIYVVDAFRSTDNWAEKPQYALTKESALAKAKAFERGGSALIEVNKYTNASFFAPKDFQESGSEEAHQNAIEDWFYSGEGTRFHRQAEEDNCPCVHEGTIFEMKTK